MAGSVYAIARLNLEIGDILGEMQRIWNERSEKARFPHADLSYFWPRLQNLECERLKGDTRRPRPGGWSLAGGRA